MRQAWRWFGPNDPVTLDHVRQAGATDVVSALHHLPPGTARTRADVERHRDLIETTPPGRMPLTWSVVESIPVPDDVKRLGAAAKDSIAAWNASLEAVVAALIRTLAAGLPGTTTDALDLDAFRERLALYEGVDARRARANLIAFLEAVTPIAEQLGVALTLHPDD